MDKDDQKIMEYNKRISEAVHNHNEYASRETIKFMEKVNVELCYLKTDITEIKDKVNTLPDKKDLELLTEKTELMAEKTVRSVLEAADLKYASQKEFSFVRKIVYGFISIIVLGALGVIGWLINSHLGVK